MLAEYLNAARRLWPAPAALLHFAGRVTGRTGVIDRFVSELRLDCSRIRERSRILPMGSASNELARDAIATSGAHEVGGGPVQEQCV